MDEKIYKLLSGITKSLSRDTNGILDNFLR